MKKKTFLPKFLAFSAIFAITLSGFGSSTFASTTSISGGNLTGGSIGFSELSATLNGSKQTTDASWSISDISDARGTGDGWNLSLTMSQFKEFDSGLNAYVDGGKDLATNSLKITSAPIVSLKDDTSSPTSTIATVNANTTLDNGNVVKLLTAGIDGGMGSYTFGNLGVELFIPANAYAKTYKTEATVSLNTAP